MEIQKQKIRWNFKLGNKFCEKIIVEKIPIKTHFSEKTSWSFIGAQIGQHGA